jgi:thiamine pyrophosphate-dependent acetolactate synthase large subunit-like protein
MEQKEIFKMEAESNAKHLQSKLNEAEAEALEGIALSEQKINSLNIEVETCQNKREILKQSLQRLKDADDSSWKQACKEFIESIEKLEDKGIFKTKTEEWFNTIRNIAGDLKEGIKEKAAKW